MILLQKTNKDWWSVRQKSGHEGYVPANYMKDVDPKIIQKVRKRPVKVPKKVRVIKTGTRKEVVQRKPSNEDSKRSNKLRRTPSGKQMANFSFCWLSLTIRKV